MDHSQQMNKLYQKLEQIEVYQRTLGKLQFDLECCAPPMGMAQAGADMAVVGQQLFALEHEKELEELICRLHQDSAQLAPVEQKLVEHLYDQYRKIKNFTPEFAYEMDKISAQAYGDWLAAKKASDFSLYQPTLEKLIALTRQAIDLRDEKPASYYDACLDDYEKGGSIAQLDAFFDALKARIVPLMRRIAREGKTLRSDFLTRPCPIPAQEAFSRQLLKLEGLRDDTLVLMSTEHPFTTNFGPLDVRVTTHYYEQNFVSNIFSTLHEGGHALFMQNEPQELYDLHAANHMSNAMHECISRFYENLIGRSEAFIQYLYPHLTQLHGGAFADISQREFYEGVNIAQPGLLRTEADELTYCLHILIRYELEKQFINGQIAVHEIPQLWNEKYREYLGVDVPDAAQGCLQDVHWTGMFGYFPSYALGNAYGAQILRRMRQDFDVDAAVAEGQLDRVLGWLKTHVFAKASLLTPDQWIRDITGEPLNVSYYLDYLEEKFTALYGL
jgi:Zn-dependent M32 family carboxypeptidase